MGFKKDINAKIREEKRAMRESFSEAVCQAASRDVCHKLWELFYSHPHAGVFLTYYHIRNEIDLSSMHENLLMRGQELYFPVVEGDDIRFYYASSRSDFAVGEFGCYEPTDRRLPFDPTESAVAFVPGVAFSEKGDRIGFGRGYYDRFFSEHPDIIRVGVCYEAQLTDKIEPKDTDVPMNMIVTEKRIMEIK